VTYASEKIYAGKNNENFTDKSRKFKDDSI
jgi:hypothetical protein